MILKLFVEYPIKFVPCCVKILFGNGIQFTIVISDIVLNGLTFSK